MLRNLKKTNNLTIVYNILALVFWIVCISVSVPAMAQEEVPEIPSDEEITTEEPKGEEWEQVECTTEGCRYRNRITGRVLFMLKKVVQTPGKVLGITPKNSTTHKPATQYQSSSSMEDTNDGEKLRYTFKTFKEMTDAFQKAKDDGAKYVIIQLGNLEGCPPCQAVNRAIEQRLLSKRADIAVMDFNAFQNRESDAIDFFYNKISSGFKIYKGFSFPQIYVMFLNTHSNWWTFKYTINGQSNSVDTVMKGIEQIVNRSVESLSDETKQQGLAH